MNAADVQPGRHYAASIARRRAAVVKVLYVSVSGRVFVRDVAGADSTDVRLIPAAKLWYEVARDGDRWRKVGNRKIV